MKICIINNIYPPYHRGGAEQVVVRTVQGMLDAGHQVVVITACPRGEYVERHENGLTIYRFRPKNIFFYTDAHKYPMFMRFVWHLIDIGNTSVSRKVRSILEHERPDVVHTHNLMGLSFLIPNVVRNLGLPQVHTVHDVQLVEPSGVILKEKETSWRYTGFPTKMYTWLMRKLVGSPNVVISPSQFLLNFYQTRGFFSDSRSVIVRNPITFSMTGSQAHIEKKDAIMRFMYVGQVEKHKGILLLLDAYMSLDPNMLFQTELHVVGGGSSLGDVHARSARDSRVRVYGRVKRDELPSLFASMDVTVVPSLCYENSPTVIFESLSFGIPILASNIEGVAELIREGENGRTFKTGDALSLKEALRWCVEHAGEIRAMSKKTEQSLLGLSQKEYTDKVCYLYGEAIDEVRASA